jgi:tRNA-splicing ligase RtcB
VLFALVIFDTRKALSICPKKDELISWPTCASIETIMSNQKIDIKDLKKANLTSDVARSVGMNIMNRHFKHMPKEQKLETLVSVLAQPELYVHHLVLGQLAQKFIVKPRIVDSEWKAYELDDKPKHFDVFGIKCIEESAIHQMELAMRLPIATKGALMPDAHHGYGLPIGGVLATENSVIPYGVGMDIGCRMALSILDLPGSYVEHNAFALAKALKQQTHFGSEGGLEFKQEHEILDHPDFKQTALLRRLHGKVVRQLGSSGSGNHFVEFGVVEIGGHSKLTLPAGRYGAILSHSGSRSLGANIAQHYTKIAMSKCKLPAEARHLAWLDVNSDEGGEYWLSMNLAGEFAKACHESIHANLCKALGFKAIRVVENHHNFAWKEKFSDGREYIVHRKGATPASKDLMGIIPGSMIAPGFIVSGLGNELALNSAAHGAGRKMSRQKAKSATTMSSLRKVVKAEKVELIGGSPEEAPIAYKDIDEVMKCQGLLVSIEGKFYPRIVRMAKD